ncbi:hypothetical protein BD769DRAFT_1658211 [Suillus cothurnatus]|nr:hypothetical protein BD769DRAFT_1658211 [Suillus cothurnatus]
MTIQVNSYTYDSRSAIAAANYFTDLNFQGFPGKSPLHVPPSLQVAILCQTLNLHSPATKMTWEPRSLIHPADLPDSIRGVQQVQDAEKPQDVLKHHHNKNRQPQLPDPDTLELLHQVTESNKPTQYSRTRRSSEPKDGPKPTQLACYGPHWKAFLEDAKRECCTEHALENPFLTLVQDLLVSVTEVLVVVLVAWDQDSKQFKAGIWPDQKPNMAWLLYDDLATWWSDLKKNATSIAPIQYSLIPPPSVPAQQCAGWIKTAAVALLVNSLLCCGVDNMLSFYILLPGLQMPRLSYVWCSCESYRYQDNPDASGQKLQAIQTAARHHDTDQQLHDACATLEPVDNVASGHDLPVHEPFGADKPFGHSDDDGEVNLDYPELLDNLFEMWNEPPNVQGPDNFSTDEDEEIFQRLGRSNAPEDDVEDPTVPDDDPGAVPEDGDGVPREDEAVAAIDLFVSQGIQFDFSDVQEAADIHTDPPSCMNDHPAVHNAYICAFISAAFYNATHVVVYHDLEGKEHLLCTAQQANPDIEYPGLDNFACTLPTLLR